MNRVVHFEIQATDLDKIQAFYQAVFGWDMQDLGAQFGNYRTIKTGEMMPATMNEVGINGGMGVRQGDLPKPGDATNSFVCIIGIENIDATLEKIKNVGGTIALDKVDVPTVGTLAYCKDPEGTLFGILQPSPAMAA